MDFTETIILPRVPAKISSEALRVFLEPLHLILGISYYKLYCPRKILLPFRLSKEQAAFWNTVYRKGLGEFLYRNTLDPHQIARFPFSQVKPKPARLNQTDQLLLGIGGGKDSIVAAELLKKFDVTSLSIATQRKDEVAEAVMNKIGNPKLHIQRILDPKIFQPHPGAYNGHIPISAIYAFTGLLTSALYGYRSFIVANEHSSNFGNITYRGESINHQWSKSAEFEALLQDYCRAFLSPDVTYFSLLRPFYEIRVAKLFAQHKKYFQTFTSCNRSFRILKERPGTQWCGECPKCAFVFLMLAPFLSKHDLISIFKKNLFADKRLIPLYRDLLGKGAMKPFDCVGTFEESQAAFYLAAKKYSREPVIKSLCHLIKNGERLVEQVMKTALAPTLPTPFRLLGIEQVGLLGYGREGKVTERYLRKNFSGLKIGIIDKTSGKGYLTEQERYDLLIKTPGIPKRVVTRPYTTATNLFFALNKNLTIGVTGSKGKSTTASLIHDMLKAGGKKVRLLGNIGNPMLGALMTKPKPDEIFVIELSSYMLDDIEYSPNIAVLLNLFPEHMDYHGGIKQYYAAKERIFQYQTSGDRAFRFPFNARIPLKESDIPLKGKHNLQNIKAAITVAKALNIPDSVIKRSIKNFKPLPHRLERVGTYQGITFYDDAISTTPESTMMAIKTLKNVGTIFLGGEDRGYDFRQLERVLRKFQIKNIVLFPDTGSRILKSTKGFRVLKTRSMRHAVAFAYQHTPKGRICLLSTASPSYSLWKDFEEKGNEFKRFVKQSKVS